MPDYTKYSVSADDVPRRRRQRRDGDRRRRRRFLWLKLTLVVVFLAVIAVLGAAAGTIFALSRNLPSLDSLQRLPDSRNTIIYDRNGRKIAELYGGQNRVVVPSDKIAEVMKQATVAIEDKRFYEHHGIDFQGTLRAAVEDLLAGHVVQGGSTITEQYIKNAYVGNERTIARKIREAWLAWQLEDKWTKDQILTAYLNTVFYGSQAAGVEAAAETYFHVHASQLSLKQAALLAAIPKAPTTFDPISDPAQAMQRRNLVLQTMASEGYITPAKAAATMKKPLGVYKHPPASADPLADYFLNYVKVVLTQRYGTQEVFEGGLRVYTSIDMRWQRDAIDVIKKTTGPLNFGFKPSAALVAIDPKTGYIRAMVGGLDYQKQQFNLAWQAKRQAGSSMKPFVLANAVEQGMNPWTTYYNSHSPIVIPMGAGAKPWVVNGDGPGGMENVANATKISDNVVFAQLSVDAGPQKTATIARRMGITSHLAAVPSITLGTSPVTPLEMADAYATLASGGIHHPPQPIVKVVLPNGRVDWKPSTKGTRVIPAGVASVVTQCLEPVTQAGGTASLVGNYFPYPRAGKTGTTDQSWDVWFDGYTPELAAAVWMGDMYKNSPMNGAYGGIYCAPIWAKFMAAALKGSKHPDFVRVPWTFSKWDGKYAGKSPSPSASPSTSGSPSPGTSPTPTKTIKPTVTPTPTPTKPSPTPSKTASPKPTGSPTKVKATGVVGMLGDWLSGLLPF